MLGRSTLGGLGIIAGNLLGLTLFLQPCHASITVAYPLGQTPLGAVPTPTAYTGPAAYNPVVLNAPAPPGPSGLPTAFTVGLTNAVPATASTVKQSGSFFGFSVEMSIVNQIFGTNSSIIQVPFLNLMSNLVQRVGQVHIRVGGNTQETAVLVPSTPDGRILEKDTNNTSNPTSTPPLIYTPEMLYMLSNISSLVNIKWYIGIPFFNTTPFNLDIAEAGQAILGDNLIGMQAANEPDLYANHGHRPLTYSPQDFFNEFGEMITQMKADSKIPIQNNLVAPSVSSMWTPDQVFATGFVTSYGANLGFLSVEHYPSDNCAAVFPQPGVAPRDPQTVFPEYLNHQNAVGNAAIFSNASIVAQQNGKPMLMFETNTASCGGFPGVSDSFGAALWGADYALQLASVGFSGALYHVGGQGVAYNPFLPPPTNVSYFKGWTVGPIYYASLVVAEAIGATNTTQIQDLQANTNNQFSPAYGIWENGQLARAVLFNFASDSTGASDLNVTITMTDGSTALPSSVRVKYLQASSVAQKYNFTWAGQTFGDIMSSDGRPVGQEVIDTVQCSGAPTSCVIPVPAPCIALVFIASSSLNDNVGGESKTYSTTAITRFRNTATVDPSVLATSNGHKALKIGSTSPGALKAGAERRFEVVGVVVMVLVGAIWGGALIIL